MHPSITFKDFDVTPRKIKRRIETETITVDKKRIFISGDMVKKAGLKPSDKVRLCYVYEHDRLTNRCAIVKSNTGGYTLCEVKGVAGRLAIYSGEASEIIASITDEKKLYAQVVDGNIVFGPKEMTVEGGKGYETERISKFEFGKGNNFGKSKA